jgi:hypothetical protein
MLTPRGDYFITSHLFTCLIVWGVWSEFFYEMFIGFYKHKIAMDLNTNTTEKPSKLLDQVRNALRTKHYSILMEVSL